MQASRIALVLQGGGALGAYHIGAYQALEQAGLRPDWVSGISIGAINAAIIAGNAPERRLARLTELWEEISWPNEWGTLLHGPARVAFNEASVAGAVLFGQPNFWTPRIPNPALLPYVEPEQAGYCDPSPMRATLARLADFHLVNAKPVRLSLGATRLSTGELEFFDNFKRRIDIDHVLASGSLPPGFPPVRIGKELYWDGGCVSNTPLEAIYADEHGGHTLVFMIDLWSAAGPPPTTMDQVNWRQKQIQYASRSSHAIASLATQHNLRRALVAAGHRLPVPTSRDAVATTAAAEQPDKTIDIVHVIYRPSAEEISASDAEFSRPSIAARRDAGFRDLRAAIAASPWRERRAAPATASIVHRVENGRISTVDCG
ncbi:MAG TPA: patatin-like phospholipase family protein [Casimicrobiaceae bacterium]|nr:patatin-like phospholipase family protein [Casimicrobiaceae bacterium]